MVAEPLQLGTIARNASESAHPGLWRGLVGAWVPALGFQGGRLNNIVQKSPPSTMAGSPIWAPNALTFDGSDDEVLVPDFPALDFGSSGTVWMRFRANTNTNHLHNADESQPGRHLLWISDGTSPGAGDLGALAGGFRDSTDSFISGTLVNSGSTRVDDGGWHTGAVSYDGSVLTLWLDGSLIASSSDSGKTIAAITDTGRLGNHPTVNRRLDGAIAADYQFARALTPSEHHQLHIDPLAPFRRADDAWLYAATAGTGFQPAWALYSNDTIGAA